MTKEDILSKTMGVIPLSRIIKHHESIFYAMDEYARQQAVAFDEWRIKNRWFSFDQGHYYHTFEQGTSMSEGAYLKHYVKTREQLYDQFIESQNK